MRSWKVLREVFFSMSKICGNFGFAEVTIAREIKRKTLFLVLLSARLIVTLQSI